MRKISAATCLLTLVACGGGPNWQAPPANERLNTQIAADGTKFFVFHRSYLQFDRDDEDFRRGRSMAGQRGARSSGPIYAEWDVTERLTAIMERTGYCREGFFELYREQTFSDFSVRGECREGASDADRAQFDSQSIALD